MSLNTRSVLRLLVLLVLAICLVRLIAPLYDDPQNLQWDFHTYYHASVAHEAGLDPYDAENISRVSGKNWTPPYIYPPLTLKVFSLLHGVDYPAAARIWLFLKIAMLGCLVLVWKRYFDGFEDVTYFLVFLVFAFASTVYWDLKTGNVSLVEQFFLWTGFLMLIKGRTWAFCLMLLAASMFKLSFVLFLPLLLVIDTRGKWLYITGTAIVMAAYIATNRFLYPDLFAEYVGLIRAADDLGDRYNLGSLAIVTDLFKNLGVGSWRTLSILVYAAVVALVLSITVRTVWPARRFVLADKRLVIFLACVLYVVCMPRMKSYSFIVMIAPAYFIMSRQLKNNAFPFLILLLVLPIRSPFDGSEFFGHFKNYYSLYLAYLVWVLYLGYIREAGHLERRSE